MVLSKGGVVIRLLDDIGDMEANTFFMVGELIGFGGFIICLFIVVYTIVEIRIHMNSKNKREATDAISDQPFTFKSTIRHCRELIKALPEGVKDEMLLERLFKLKWAAIGGLFFLTVGVILVLFENYTL